jgi:hypothetical protein
MRLLIAGLTMISSTVLLSNTAQAYHCGHGQIYRVHLHTCVGERSALAKVAFVHTHHVSFIDLPQRHHHHHRIKDPIMGNDPDDPIEDRVVDPPTPVVSSTPRQDVPKEAQTPSQLEQDISLPDPFGKSAMKRNWTVWRLQ